MVLELVLIRGTNYSQSRGVPGVCRLAAAVLPAGLGGRQQQRRAGARGGERRGVRLDVLAQVVGSHEGLVADCAGELLFPGVDAHMPMELIGTGKLFATKRVLAHERLLARVPPQVCLQVRCLAVLLAAAGVVADVHQLLAIGPIQLLLALVSISGWRLQAKTAQSF